MNYKTSISLEQWKSVRRLLRPIAFILSSCLVVLVTSCARAHAEVQGWGFVDPTGKLIIEPRFDASFSFSDDLAAVCPDGELCFINGKWGFIDKTGEVVIEPQFTWAWEFSEGLACVSLGDKYGFIDKTGKLVIEPQFDSVEEFSEGLAPVKLGAQFGFVDKDGRLAIKPQFTVAHGFRCGRASVLIGTPPWLTPHGVFPDIRPGEPGEPAEPH